MFYPKFSLNCLISFFSIHKTSRC